MHSERWCTSEQHLKRMRPSFHSKLKRDSSEKTTCCRSARQCLCQSAQFSRRSRQFCVRGILHKGTLARSPRLSRFQRNVARDNNTHVEVLRLSDNCRDQAVWFVTAMWMMCLSSCGNVTFCHPQPDFRIALFSCVYYFYTRITDVALRSILSGIAR